MHGKVIQHYILDFYKMLSLSPLVYVLATRDKKGDNCVLS